MTAVTLRNLNKHFVGYHAIRDVNLAIQPQEFVVLVGPSGCGKSTLLRMIAGLETVSSGDIEIVGKVVNQIPAKNRNIAMVFQNYALYPHKTVYENMAFSLRLKKQSRDVIDRRVREAAEILALGPLLDRKPSQLSGGQRQRVAMGRAIVRDSKIFLFDEPLSNLDAKLRVQMRIEIRALHQRLGCTTIYVTHDQIEAMTMADRIVVMNTGIIEQVGTPDELYEHPANLFVAGFIGSPSMNLLDGMIEADANGLSVDHQGHSLPIVPFQAARSGMEVVCGVRPEHVDVVADGSPQARNATIDVVERTGPGRNVVLDFAATRVTATIDNKTPLSVGQKVEIVFQAEEVHLFDRATGNNLKSQKGRQSDASIGAPAFAQ